MIYINYKIIKFCIYLLNIFVNTKYYNICYSFYYYSINTMFVFYYKILLFVSINVDLEITRIK